MAVTTFTAPTRVEVLPHAASVHAIDTRGREELVAVSARGSIGVRRVPGAVRYRASVLASPAKVKPVEFIATGKTAKSAARKAWRRATAHFRSRPAQEAS